MALAPRAATRRLLRLRGPRILSGRRRRSGHAFEHVPPTGARRAVANQRLRASVHRQSPKPRKRRERGLTTREGSFEFVERVRVCFVEPGAGQASCDGLVQYESRDRPWQVGSRSLVRGRPHQRRRRRRRRRRGGAVFVGVGGQGSEDERIIRCPVHRFLKVTHLVVRHRALQVERAREGGSSEALRGGASESLICTRARLQRSIDSCRDNNNRTHGYSSLSLFVLANGTNDSILVSEITVFAKTNSLLPSSCASRPPGGMSTWRSRTVPRGGRSRVPCGAARARRRTACTAARSPSSPLLAGRGR